VTSSDGPRRVVNATLAARNPRIRNEGTTACAADSKHFGAFDQNLMTQWRPLRRAPRHDLLACRARLGVHPLTPAALLVRNRCGGITYKFCARVETMSSVAD
jgi:hypothetical protein